MDTILGYATKLGAGKHHSAKNDDVFIDRLNHRYTVSMILIFAAIVTTQQYFGSPITCWVPAQFTGGYEKYANDICWIMNTYYVPMEHDIPHAETTRYERMLKYYQWSPFILMFMALCFYFPRMLWRALNNKSGLDMDRLVEIAMKTDDKENENGGIKKAKQISQMIENYVENRYSKLSNASTKKNAQKFYQYIIFWRHRHLSSYLFILFTVVKFLFVLNSGFQFFFLNSFLGNEYHLFGFEVIRKFVGGLDWGESKRFPRVTLCDFHIREIGIVHRYTVQCVLPINLFNEKIFLVLWFWISILTIFNLGDFVAWLIRIIRLGNRTSYVERKLSMMGNTNLAKSSQVDLRNEFVRDYLQPDGCFALRLLARNGHDLIVGQVINDLYTNFCENEAKKHMNTDQPIRFTNSTKHQTTFHRVPASNGGNHIADEERLLMARSNE